MNKKEHAKKCASNKAHLPSGSPLPCDCDDYHTFGELYDHRIRLYITLCEKLTHLIHPKDGRSVWRSKLHSDGTGFEDWFVLGINTEKGKQITYYLPDEMWEETNFAETLEKAPEWDGHTSDDVLERLKNV